MQIALGTDIKTKEVIPNSDFMVAVNLSGVEHDPEGELVIAACPDSECDFFKNIEKINIAYPADMILRSGSRVMIIENLQAKTLERYSLGKVVSLAIINESKKIIARYEI